MMPSRFPVARAVTIAALLLGSSVATLAAADDPPATPPSQEKGREKGKDKGRGAENPPRTPPEGVSGPARGKGGADGAAGGGRAGGEGRERARGEARGPMSLEIVRSLDLTAEQKTKVDEIQKEWDASMAAFDTEYGPKLKEIQAKREAEKKASGKVSPETMQALKEINSKRPSPDSVTPKLMAVLTDDQKAKYRTKLKESQDRRRGDAPQREGREGRDAGGGKPDGERKGTPPKRDRPSGGGAGSGSGAGGGTPPTRQ